MGLVSKESVEAVVDGEPEVGLEVRVFEDLPGSAKPGTTLGEVVVSVDGKRVGERLHSSPARANDATSLWERVWYTVGGFLRRRGRGQRRPGR